MDQTVQFFTTEEVAITATSTDTTETASAVPVFRCALIRDSGCAFTSKMPDPITNPVDLVEAVEPLFQGADREIFVALALDARNRAIGSNIVSIGTLAG